MTLPNVSEIRDGLMFATVDAHGYASLYNSKVHPHRDEVECDIPVCAARRALLRRLDPDTQVIVDHDSLTDALVILSGIPADRLVDLGEYGGVDYSGAFADAILTILRGKK